MAEEKIVEDMGNLDTLRKKLMTVTNEIDSIKDSFSKGTEDLERIQKMLHVENIDEISGVLEHFENRVQEAEKQKAEAAEGAKKYSTELEKEKERLVKLWDAYKNQEEELSNTEKKMTDYEEKLKNMEAEKKQIEEDMTARINTLNQKIEENREKVQDVDKYQEKLQNYEEIKNNLENKVNTLRQENETKNNQIQELNEKVGKLGEMENYKEYKEKYEQINAEYEKEKERLTKLYQLYEDTDNECKRLQKENKEWESWYEDKKGLVDKLFSASPPVAGANPGPTTNTNEDYEPPETQDNIDVEKPQENNPGDNRPNKKKRKLRFGKK